MTSESEQLYGLEDPRGELCTSIGCCSTESTALRFQNVR
jgi:hypothetical protein